MNNYNEQKIIDSSKTKSQLSDVKSYFGLSIRIMLLNELCLKISLILNNLIINKESIDKYNELLALHYENKLLINKLSSTILLLKNPNIINFKRKVVEALIFEIIEKYPKNFNFSSAYFPNMFKLKELKDLINKKFDSYEGIQKDKFKKDIKDIEDMLNSLKEKTKNKTAAFVDTIIPINKKDHQIKMIIEFLRFCKKSLHPLVHAEKDNINYYLLPRNLFNSNLQYADYMFPLDDLFKKGKNTNNNDENEKEGEDNLNLNETYDWNIYKKNKEITINEALDLLFNVKSTNLLKLKEDNNKNLSTKKNQLKQNLKIFNKYFNSFTKMSFDNFLDNKLIPKEEMLIDKDEDIINKIKIYDELLSKILKDEINRIDAENIINEIKDIIEGEVRKSKDYIYSIDNTDMDYNDIYQKINSKVCLIGFIIKFLNAQSEKFSKTQQNLYRDYEDSAKIIIQKSEEINKLLEVNYSVKNENLIDKWIKSKPDYSEMYLNEEVIIKNFKDLLTGVRLDISHSYDESFVLWCVQNKYSDYLKN